ncbi:MAG: hypothetical protein KDE27_11895 [Planctomycetes bacterium]|nr:hypothetical protein [Planctomycetota bacterium]
MSESHNEQKKPLIEIDPKDLAPAGAGFFLGILIVVGFFALALAMGLPTFVEQANIPRQ